MICDKIAKKSKKKLTITVQNHRPSRHPGHMKQKHLSIGYASVHGHCPYNMELNKMQCLYSELASDEQVEERNTKNLQVSIYIELLQALGTIPGE